MPEKSSSAGGLVVLLLIGVIVCGVWSSSRREERQREEQRAKREQLEAERRKAFVREMEAKGLVRDTVTGGEEWVTPEEHKLRETRDKQRRYELERILRVQDPSFRRRAIDRLYERLPLTNEKGITYR